MPTKVRKKASPQKKTDKNAQVLVEVRGLNKKFSKKFNGLDKKFNGLDKKFNGLDKKFNGLDKKVDEYRKENVADRKSFSRILFRNREEQRMQHDELVEKFNAFTDKILTIADSMRKEYDETRQERIIIGAVQDRQRGELETLKFSDAKQNQLLASLDTRVTELEMNKAA